MQKKITRREISKALNKALQIKFHVYLIAFQIEPRMIRWYFAISERSSEKKEWRPKIVAFIDDTQKCVFWESVLDMNPKVANATSIIALAEDPTLADKVEK